MAKKLSAAALAAPQPDATDAMQVEHVAVAGLSRHPRNARTIPPTQEQSAALVASVRAVGVLMPVLLAPMDGGAEWGVLAGWQRVCAAQDAGRATVPAIRVQSTQAALDRLSLIENTLRSDMHPVDAWRSVDLLMQGGAKMADAAAALGLSGRVAGQMVLLSRMHPDLLEWMAKGSVPGTHVLRDIARAPPERQAEALKGALIGKGKDQRVEWNSMAAACRVERIPRAWAVFPHAKSSVQFERDLFAEPGDSHEWTTTDVDGFRAAQRAALEALVAGREDAAVYQWSTTRSGPEVPPSWFHTKWFDKVPKAVPDLDARQRFVVAMKPSGEAAALIYRVPAEVPHHTPETPGSDDRPAAPKRLITDAGLRMAATMKHQAMQDALANLHDYPPTDTVPILLRALLECLGAANVTPGAADKHAALEAIADATPDGGEPDPLRLVQIAAETIAAMLVFPAPKVFSSGPIAESVALSLGADRHLPRFDTADFLAQCSGSLLREAARHADVQPGQRVPNGVGELRHFLVGKLPDWRPVGFLQEAASDE